MFSHSIFPTLCLQRRDGLLLFSHSKMSKFSFLAFLFMLFHKLPSLGILFSKFCLIWCSEKRAGFPVGKPMQIPSLCVLSTLGKPLLSLSFHFPLLWNFNKTYSLKNCTWCSLSSLFQIPFFDMCPYLDVASSMKIFLISHPQLANGKRSDLPQVILFVCCLTLSFVPFTSCKICLFASIFLD